MTTLQLLSVLEYIEDVLISRGAYDTVYHFGDRVVFSANNDISVSVLPRENAVHLYHNGIAKLTRIYNLAPSRETSFESRMQEFRVCFATGYDDIMFEYANEVVA